MMYNDGTKAKNYMVWPEFTVRARFVHTRSFLAFLGGGRGNRIRLGAMHMDPSGDHYYKS